MSKKPSHARQPVSRVTRNQPSAPRAGKSPIKPVGGAPQGHPHDKRRADEKHRFDEPRFNKDEKKPFGKPAAKGRFGDSPPNKPYGKGEERFSSEGGKGRFGEERKPYGQGDNRPGKGDLFKQVGSQGRFDDERRFGDERKPGSKPYGKPAGEGRFGDERKPGNKPYGKPAGEGRFGDERKPGNKPYGKPAGEGRFGDERKPYGKPAGESRFGDERKPYGKPAGEGRFGDERKPYGKPAGESRFGDERKPYGKPAGEGRFGDERKPGSKPYGKPGAEPSKGFGEARSYGKSNKPSAPVERARKLQVRDPNQKIQDRTKELRQTRVDIDSIEPIRLQKALAASGAGSRREMEEAIEAGQVTVNGKQASLGDKVGPRDKVVYKGHPIKLKWADRLPRIVIYHKQEGEIVSRDDPGGRVTVFERLPQAKSSRWVAVGRLDVNTSGLLIITTSGELVNRMAHPSFEAEREYAVRVLGELSDEQKKAVTSEVLLDDGPAKFDRLIDQGGEGVNHWYRVVIKEGRNREVRRMFEAYGLTVSRLIRLRFGPIGLPARLKRGQFYELNELEVANVMKWAGLTVTGQVKPPKEVSHRR